MNYDTAKISRPANPGLTRMGDFIFNLKDNYYEVTCFFATANVKTGRKVINNDLTQYNKISFDHLIITLPKSDLHDIHIDLRCDRL